MKTHMGTLCSTPAGAPQHHVSDPASALGPGGDVKTGARPGAFSALAEDTPVESAVRAAELPRREPLPMPAEGEWVEPKQGYLYRVVGDSLVKQWFVLEDGVLYYFAKKTQLPREGVWALGYLDLRSAKLQAAPDAAGARVSHSGTKYQLELEYLRHQHLSRQSFVLLADNAAQYEDWVSHIGLAQAGAVHRFASDEGDGGGADESKAEDGVGGRRSRTASSAPAYDANPASAEPAPEPPTKTGVLSKKGQGSGGGKLIGRRNWKQRTFQLRDSELRYYAREDMRPSSLKGIVPLDGCIVAPIADPRHPHAFKVYHPERRLLELYAGSQRIMDEWIEAIQLAINLTPIHDDNAAGRSRARRGVLSTMSESLAPRTRELEPVPKAPETEAVLVDALQHHFLFQAIQDPTPLLDSMTMQRNVPGDVLIWQGAPGDLFFVIESGTCEVVKNGQPLGNLGAGKAFGELALLHAAPRAATIRALDFCVSWTVDRHRFRRLLQDLASSGLEERVGFLQSVDLLKPLRAATLQRVAEALQVTHWAQDQYVIRQGEMGDSFHIVKEGEVAVTQTNTGTGAETEVARLRAGDYFGEMALMQDEPRNANVRAADGPVECYSLDREDFDGLLGPLREVLDQHAGVNILQGVKLLQGLSETELERISRVLERATFPAGTAIIEQGAEGTTFYMIDRGEVVVRVDGREVGRLQAGSYFGEIALLRNEPRNATVEAAGGEVECLTLDRAAFTRLLGPLDSILRREAERRKNALLGGSVRRMFRGVFSRSEDPPAGGGGAAGAGGAPDNRAALAAARLDEFVVYQTLATGTFSRVKLAHHEPTDTALALKEMAKQGLVKAHQQKNVVSERRLLMALDHPFICKVYNAFQDANCVYLMLELVPGGELWTLLHGDTRHLPRGPTGGLMPEDARFYMGSVLSALQYMHARDVVHRDIKPENLLIDARGYPKLVDFGFAKKLTTFERTNTLCGTPEYLAPEQVMAHGHHRAVDYWALGILLFELLTCNTPFYAEDSNKLFKKIAQSGQYLPRAFPGTFDPQARDLVERLLHPNPTMRLGCLRGGVQDIIDHPWFADLQFDLLEREALVAPYVPRLRNALDTVNFEEPGEVDPVPYTGRVGFDGF